MKISKYISILLLLCLTLTSCDDFLDVNENKDVPTSVPPEELLPTIIFYGSLLNYDHGEYSAYLSNNLTTTGKSQTNAYAYRGGWDFLTMSRHPQWRRHYYDIGTNVGELLASAQKKGAYNYILVARTIRLMSTLLTTDMFGDMPLKEAYTSTTPRYDTQQEIYDWMEGEFNDVLAKYDDPSWTNAVTNPSINSSKDRIYAGDLKKWQSLTYALQARMLLRKLPNWENTPENCRRIINAVDSALVNWEEPHYTYPGGGSAESNCPWGPSRPQVNSWESFKNGLDATVPSKFFMEDIMGVHDSFDRRRGWADDPRLIYMMKRNIGPEGDNAQKYRYLENNIGIDASYNIRNYPDLTTTDGGKPVIWTQNTSFISYMLTEELLLIKAEAQYWMGLKDEAAETTKEAVTVSFNRYGIENATYVTRYFEDTKYFPVSGFNIGHLMRQKYVCLYLQAEQWNDMRRYKYSNSTNNIAYDGVIIYPTLQRPYNLLQGVWGGNQDWVQRINYDPQTENIYNPQELIRLNAYQNPNWLKEPMIWAK
ncbi:MAG: SusD/RagB family nutrient-binding outer membrane lipoprotein [Dysgonomonas sp.]